MFHLVNHNRPALSGRTMPEPSDTDHVVTWDDVSENVRAVKALADGGSAYLKEVGCFDDSWLGRGGISNWSDACDAVEQPWPEGLERIEDMIAELEREDLLPPHSIRRAPMWREDDGEFHLDRFADGQAAWRGVNKRDATGQQFVTILVQIAANCDVSAESMLWRGATAVALCHLIEDQGYSCEILSYEYAKRAFDSGRGFVNSVWIKRPHNHLDISALTNAVAPWYARMMGFASYAFVPGQKPMWNLGTEVKLPAYLAKHLTPDENYWQVEDIWSLSKAKEACAKFLQTLRLKPEEEAMASSWQ